MASNPYCGEYLDVAEQINWLRDRVSNGDGFLHTRYNDGEMISIYHLRSETHMTGREHHYTKEVNRDLHKAFMRLIHLCKESHKTLKRKPDNLLVGSYWFTEHWHYAVKYLIDEVGLETLRLVPWSYCDLWYSTKDEEKGIYNGCILELLEDIRYCSKASKRFTLEGREVVLVCNDKIQPACHCLGATCILIPSVDAHSFSVQIRKQCLPYAKRGALFIWAAGFAGKPIMLSLWEEYNQSGHIDVGHFFDGAMGHYSRGWLRRKDGAHWKYYSEVITTYIRNAIPR